MSVYCVLHNLAAILDAILDFSKGGIRWIINVEGLNFQKTPKHFVCPAKHGPVKLLPDYNQSYYYLN